MIELKQLVLESRARQNGLWNLEKENMSDTKVFLQV